MRNFSKPRTVYRTRDLANMRIELDQSKNTMVDLITTMGMINTGVEYGEKVRIDLSTEIKEKKIILAGVPESKGEKIKTTVIEKLKAVLEKSKVQQAEKDYKGPKFNVNPDSVNSSMIDLTYRLGKCRKKYTRNIFVSFVRAEDRQMILRAKNTVNMQKGFNFYINEDMSHDTRNHRATLKRISKAATEAGLTSKVSGNNLIVAGKSYGKDELDILPSKVYRSCAQEKWVPRGLAFRGERSVFSNYYAKPFIIEGQKFLSMEQYIQYSKAVFGDDSNLARKILVTSKKWNCQQMSLTSGLSFSRKSYTKASMQSSHKIRPCERICCLRATFYYLKLQMITMQGAVPI